MSQRGGSSRCDKARAKRRSNYSDYFVINRDNAKRQRLGESRFVAEHLSAPVSLHPLPSSKNGRSFPPRKETLRGHETCNLPIVTSRTRPLQGGNRYFLIRGPPGDCILRHPLPPDFFCNGKSRIKTRAELEGRNRKSIARILQSFTITNPSLRDVLSEISNKRRTFSSFDNFHKREKTTSFRFQASNTKDKSFVYDDMKRVNPRSRLLFDYYEIYSVRL